jgi:hypothetical protein
MSTRSEIDQEIATAVENFRGKVLEVVDSFKDGYSRKLAPELEQDRLLIQIKQAVKELK